MKANELRIGNLVYNSHGDIHAIGCNCFHRFRYPSMDGNPSGFKPIPLTEEILLKCGFERTEYNDYRHPVLIGTLTLYEGVAELHLSDMYSVWADNLHQLQNLYFILTQEELCVDI